MRRTEEKVRENTTQHELALPSFCILQVLLTSSWQSHELRHVQWVFQRQREQGWWTTKRKAPSKGMFLTLNQGSLAYFSPGGQKLYLLYTCTSEQMHIPFCYRMPKSMRDHHQDIFEQPFPYKCWDVRPITDTAKQVSMAHLERGGVSWTMPPNVSQMIAIAHPCKLHLFFFQSKSVRVPRNDMWQFVQHPVLVGTVHQIDKHRKTEKENGSIESRQPLTRTKRRASFATSSCYTALLTQKWRGTAVGMTQ